MNHSHPCTAVRARGLDAAPEAVEDPLRRRRAHALDEVAHLGHARGAAKELRVGVGVVLDPRQVGVECLGQRLRRRQRRVGLDPRAQLLGSPGERGHEVVLLGGEVVVEQRLGDPGRARDLRHRDLVVGVLGEQPRPELEQAPAALVVLQARVRGRAHPVRSSAAPTIVSASTPWWR